MLWTQGQKQRRYLEIEPGCRLPVLSALGPSAGPILAVSAGVHGDEYEGVRAIHEVFDELEPPEELNGGLIVVPVVNPPAHRACSRLSPVDGLNMARVFPGDAQGALSQRIAHAFATQIIAAADFYLDLHSGGVRYAMPSMAGYYEADPRAAAAAAIFGAPVTWAHPIIEPGRTISSALDRGIPFLYTEAWGAGRIAARDLAMMKRGIRNLMLHLGILKGDAPAVGSAPVRKLRGVGNTDQGIQAKQAGLLWTDVQVLDRVRQGQRLGRLVNDLGETLEEYLAPIDATVGLTREMPAVEAGDTLFLLAFED